MCFKFNSYTKHLQHSTHRTNTALRVTYELTFNKLSHTNNKIDTTLTTESSKINHLYFYRLITPQVVIAVNKQQNIINFLDTKTSFHSAHTDPTLSITTRELLLTKGRTFNTLSFDEEKPIATNFIVDVQ